MTYDENPEEFTEELLELLKNKEPYNEDQYYKIGDLSQIFHADSFGDLISKYLEHTDYELIHQFVSFDEDLQVTPQMTAKWLLGKTIRPTSPWEHIEITKVDIV